MDKFTTRNYCGYGRDNLPQVIWPNNAQIAVQFVLNYEEGGENCILHGDEHSEVFLSEMFGAEAYNDRHMSMESLYEYGSRSGVWRIIDEFEKRDLPLTIFGIATALQRNPNVVATIIRNDYDVVCHGLKWIHYQHMPIDEEREHMNKALKICEKLFGQKPLGWYTGRDSPHTRSLVAEHTNLLYDSDYYGDDLPFWTMVDDIKNPGLQRPHLIIPYTLDTNDMRFASPYGFSNGEEFYQYLKDSFDCLYSEGETTPKMLNIGMHCRMVGKPGRFIAIKRFLDYIQSFQRVWIAKRSDIAQHWIKNHPFD